MNEQGFVQVNFGTSILGVQVQSFSTNNIKSKMFFQNTKYKILSKVLEINKPKTIYEKDKTFTVLNKGNGDYVTTNSWKPLFMKMETIKV